jgi:alanine racemase
MISLYDLIEYANGQLFGEPAAQLFTRFALAPHEAEPGTLFVAYRGDGRDSHQGIEDAIKHGASGVICSRPPTCSTQDVSVILVKDTLAALLLWAQKVLQKYGTRVIGIAGSTDKDATISTAAAVLETRYRVHVCDVHPQEPRLAIPLAVATLKPEHELSLLRLSATRPGDLPAVVNLARPEVAVITDLHHTGLDTFVSLDDIMDEHAALAAAVPPEGLVILNHDDDFVRPLAERARGRVISFSVDNFGGDLLIYNIIDGLNGTGFDLRYQGERYVGRWVPLLGQGHMRAVCAAVLIGLRFDINIDTALSALKHLEPTGSRMRPRTGQNGAVLIDDTHSATVETTLAALNWLAAVRAEQQRVIVVLGDIEHLGGYAAAGHRQIGRRAAEVADVFIALGPLAAGAARAAQDEGMPPDQIHITYAAHDAIKLLRERCSLTENDLVFIKGGQRRTMITVIDGLTGTATGTRQLGTGSLYRPTRPTWVEIDAGAIANNVRLIREQIGPDVELMAVVKADAYGHGAVQSSQTALLNGATYLAVGNLAEALELRGAGITAPILIMNYMPVHGIQQAIYNNLTLTVYDLESARTYERIARDSGGRIRVHVKIDTGMGRLGAMPSETVGLFRHLAKMTALDIEGIYTHFSSADSDAAITAQQVELFRNTLRPLSAAGFTFRYIHAANSPGFVRHDENHFNMVRVGLALYGLHPSPELALPPGFRPALTWKTVVAQVKTLPPGHPVGYGSLYYTQGEETIAVICAGYADGIRRAPQPWREVLIHGQRAPVIGRISMEKTIVNVSHIHDVAMGDEVVLIGAQGLQRITAEEVGDWLGTINYEVICDVLPRVSRY